MDKNWGIRHTLRVRSHIEPDGKVIWIVRKPYKSYGVSVSQAEAERLIAEEGAVLCEQTSSLGADRHSVNLF